MIWNEQDPSKQPWSTEPIRPAIVLYEYDGPTIFVAQLGFFETLFLKVEESRSTDFYLSTAISSHKIDALRDGRLSVRGALEEGTFWIVEADKALKVIRYWSCARENVPDDFFPDEGLGLYSRFGKVPDSLEQAEAFLSVKYTGEKLRQNSISFNILKNLLNTTYDAFKSVLSPAFLQNSRSSTFDLDIAAPILGSLIIAVRQPILNIDAVARKVASFGDEIATDIEGSISAQRTIFLDALRPVVALANQQELELNNVEADFSAVSRIRKVLPSEGGWISSVEFNANIDGKTQTIYISEEAGSRLHRAYERAESRDLSLHGGIVEVNGDSMSFRVKSIDGRVTTCILTKEMYGTLEPSPDFKIGTRVAVVGRFERRKRIDRLIVRGLPTFMNEPNTLSKPG